MIFYVRDDSTFADSAVGKSLLEGWPERSGGRDGSGHTSPSLCLGTPLERRFLLASSFSGLEVDRDFGLSKWRSLGKLHWYLLSPRHR